MEFNPSVNHHENAKNMEKRKNSLTVQREILEKELGSLYEKEIHALPKLDLSSLPKDCTCLVIMDMINGFVKEGNLQSPHIANIIPSVVQSADYFTKQNMPIIAFADQHDENSPEFEIYGKHCVKGTSECEIIDELKEVCKEQMLVIPKNSINGFLEEPFQHWLKKNLHIKNYVVTGDCTDICINAFAESLRSYLNMKNLSDSRVLISSNTTATYDAPGHNEKFKHFESLIELKSKGVEIFSKTI
jgi:nicotinamidase-related amidase